MSLSVEEPELLEQNLLLDKLTFTFNKLMGDVPEKISVDEYMTRLTEVYSYCFTKEDEMDVRSSRQQYLYILVEQYFKKNAEKRYMVLKNKQSLELLREYSTTWVRYKTAAKVINSLLNHLNSAYVLYEVKQGQQCYQIYQLGLNQWKLFLVENIKSTLLSALQEAITLNRDGLESSFTDVKLCIESFVCLDSNQKYYEETFERKFIEYTKEYYKRRVAGFLNDFKMSEYLSAAENWLLKEEALFKTFLPASSEKILFETLHTVLLRNQFDKLLCTFVLLLKQWNLYELAILYRLLSLIPADLLKIWPAYQTFTQKTLEKELSFLLWKTEKEPHDLCKKYVEVFIIVLRQQNELIETSFRNDPNAVKYKDIAFTVTLNENPITNRFGSSRKSAQLVAKCADLQLKSRQISEESLEEVLLLFRYLVDGDVFLHYYTKFLSSRLLEGVFSTQLEQTMLSRLSIECGSEEISKLYRMFQDVDISGSLFNEFQKTLSPVRSGAFSFCTRILVLRSAQWPLMPLPSDYNYPSQLRELINCYTNFYSDNFRGRKLTWLPHYSFGVLRANYILERGYLDIQCTTIQMAILLCFEKSWKLRLKEIQKETLLEAQLLNNNMDILLSSNLLLLETVPNMKNNAFSKSNNNNEFEPTEGEHYMKNTTFKFNSESLFLLNLNFSKKSKKINIIRAIQKNPTNSKKKTEEREIENIRLLATRAAMVRIMKMRGISSHQQLITETTAQLLKKFPQSPKLQKRAIDWLIREQYIERQKSEDGTCTYRYLT